MTIITDVIPFVRRTIVVVAATPTLLLAQSFPSFGYTPPSDWTRPTFQLSQAYPVTVPAKGSLPWEAIDFRTQPERYLQAILDYAYDGNLEVDFVVQKNAKRAWYHAPWLHPGQGGRDFVRGLTRERQSRPYELAATQSTMYRNFAVGVYNGRGAFTIGSVWRQPDKPDARRADFPEGSVSFKLLFTTAPVSAVPFLKGAPEWVADIDRSSTVSKVLASKVRLLQIDVAVKDKRSAKGGWLFGTFHYDSAVDNANPWKRMRPLALMWGDDPALTAAGHSTGARPRESWVNVASPIVAYRENPPSGKTPPPTMGWAGRANGPVDNPVSSCLSCHGTAQIPARSPMIPTGASDQQKLRWFRNMKPGDAFDAGATSLDFSLQLGVGIQNLQDSLDRAGSGQKKATSASLTGLKTLRGDFRFSRDPR